MTCLDKPMLHGQIGSRAAGAFLGQLVQGAGEAIERGGVILSLSEEEGRIVLNALLADLLA